MLSCVISFENRREFSYMWRERVLVSVSGVFVYDSHESRVRFDADSRHHDDNMGMAIMYGHFPCELSEIWCTVRLKEIKPRRLQIFLKLAHRNPSQKAKNDFSLLQKCLELIFTTALLTISMALTPASTSFFPNSASTLITCMPVVSVTVTARTPLALCTFL